MTDISSSSACHTPAIRPHAFLLSLCIFLACGWPSQAWAATRSVPSQYATIQAAVTAAANGDTVKIADGTYSGAGNRDIDFGGKNITVTSQHGAAKTIIDCGGSDSSDGSGNHRGFYIHRGETSAVVSGLTIMNGYEVEVSGVTDSGFGGGLCVIGSAVAIQNCILTANTASENGGGLYSKNGGKTITLTSCTFSANAADFGGGIYEENDASTITLTSCTFTGNMASYDGGGVYNNSVSGSIALNSDTFRTNTALESGGGVYNQADGSVITVTGCTLSTNAADFGGGIYNGNIAGSGNGSSTIILSDCSITSNQGTESGYGGGVYNGGIGTTMLMRCTVSANKGRYGGGVCNENNASGTITLMNCTVSGNSASQHGGGVYSITSGMTMITNCALTKNKATLNGGGIYGITYGMAALTNCTLTQNTASQSGGGIYCTTTSGTTALTNDILYADTGGEIVNDANTTSPMTADFCDVQGGSSGTGNLNADPLLVNTPTDLHLLSGSPCLGSGTAIAASKTTLEGTPRPAPPSIGAYELPPGHTQILWNKSSGEASLWNISPNGTTINHEYGPYSGWTAKAITEGPDGTQYLLWTNTNGMASLWNVATDFSFTQHTFGPYTGWKAVSVSTSPSGVTHLLWNKTDGTASLWIVNTSTGSFTQSTYGPYSGWTANEVAEGTTVTDLLWTNINGTASGWRINAGDMVSKSFGPYTGWTANSVAVGPDDKAHLLWNNTSGQASLWDADFSSGAFTQTSYGPFSGWTARAIATGQDDVTHLLWTHAPDGETSLWNVAGSGYTDQEYGPYPGWNAVAVSAGP